MDIRRGDIFYADLSPIVGSEQGGIRPVLIVQNDIGNRFSPTTIVAVISTKMEKSKIPTHILISTLKEITELPRSSVILFEQIRTIDKRRIKEKIGYIGYEMVDKIDKALMTSFGL